MKMESSPLHVQAAKLYMFKKLSSSVDNGYYWLPKNEREAMVKTMLIWWCQLNGY